MSATKLELVRALLIKAEASYLAGGSVAAATDGILVVDEIQPTLETLHDGARRMPPGMAGNMRRVPPAGRNLTFAFGHEAKGPGVAYSASVFPSIHRALLGAGFDGAGTFGGGTEKWEYTPTSGTGTPTSLLGELYAREEKYPFTGGYLNLERLAFEDLGIPLWNFQARTVCGTIADSAVPAVTYPALTIEPPAAVNIVFTLGSWTTTAVVRGGSLAMNRALGNRANQNAASGNAGFSPGRRSPTLEILVEATDLVGSPFHTSAGLDPYLFYAAATEVSFQINIGSVQYNRWKIIPGKVQMTAYPTLEGDEGGQLWRLPFQCNPTTVNGNDDVMFRFD